MIGKLTNMRRLFGGEWEITFSTKEDFSGAYDDLKDNPVSVEIKKASAKRSKDANALAWVLIDKIAEKMHVSKVEVYRNAIREIGGVSEMVCVQDKAVERLRADMAACRHMKQGVMKLIHGYGSTGRGGKICSAVRNELAAMKRKKLIKEYIPGEDFGPMDAAARKLAEQNSGITRDPDYGRINHGITIVVL